MEIEYVSDHANEKSIQCDIPWDIPTTFKRPIDEFQDIPSVDIAIEDVEREIRFLLKRKRQLRTQRNSLASISRIPTEIFELIFKHCAPSSQPQAWDRDPKWISFSQVCSRWRAIALRKAGLWTQPCFKHPLLAKELLARSNDLPLSVELRCRAEDRRAKEAARMALIRISNTRNLSIWADELELRQLLGSVSDLAPMLETLRVRSSGIESINPAVPLAAQDFRLPELEALITGAPLLRDLELHACILPRVPSVLGNLTRLVINNTHARRDEHSKLAVNAGTLLQMAPRLSELTLEWGIVFTLWQGVAAPPQTKLIHLKKLTIVDTLCAAMNLLHSLYLPALSHLDVRNTCLDEPSTMPAVRQAQVHALSDLRSYLQGWRTFPGRQQFRVLNVGSANNSNGLASLFTLGASVADQLDAEGGDTLRLSLHLPLDHGDSLAASIVQIFNVDQLRTFRFSTRTHDYYKNPETWKKIARVQNLSHIEVAQGAAQDFIAVLAGVRASTYSHASGNLPAQIPFPGLRSLAVHQANLRSDVRVGGEPVNCLQLLAKALEKRKEFEVPLEQLSMSNCFFSTDPTDFLRPWFSRLVVKAPQIESVEEKK